MSDEKLQADLDSEVDANDPAEVDANDPDYDDLDLENLKLPDDGFDEDDNEDDARGGDKKKWIIIGSAIFGVVATLSGGAILFLSGAPDEIRKNDPTEAVLSLKIPSKSKMKRRRMKMGSANKKSAQVAAQRAPPQKHTNIIKKSPSRSATIRPQADPAVASGSRIKAGPGLVVPSVTETAFKGIPKMQNPKPLPGPDKQLGESMGGGIIPKIASNGRQPWQVYAKPFKDKTTFARIGIIIKSLGLSRVATTAAINHTPAEVTLAFDPYAKDVGEWVRLARGAGHETLITLPMEPIDFPTSDPGPFALRTDLKQSENIDRLRYILSVSAGNVGLLQMMGTRFAISPQALTPVLKEIRTRGLLMIDDGLVRNSQIIKIASTISLPRARSDVFIDQDPSRRGILLGLSKLEAAAQKNKSAIGIIRALPNSISSIMVWTKTLPNKKFILAPISAIVKISGPGKAPAKARLKTVKPAVQK